MYCCVLFFCGGLSPGLLESREPSNSDPQVDVLHKLGSWGILDENLLARLYCYSFNDGSLRQLNEAQAISIK